MYAVVRIAALLVLVGAARPALCEPWAMPGDLGLRSDIQLLADAGAVASPVIAWPIPWAAVADGLQGWGGRSEASPEILAALARVEARIREVRGGSGIRPSVSLAARTDEFPLRTFQGSPREQGGEASAKAAWMGDRFAFGLQVQYSSDPLDDDDLRLDGSYGAVVLGNHILSAGALDRWWGPGWQGSLIYSTNARPVPAFGLERNVALPFETKWLSWIGPWSYKIVYGQLEHDRDVPNARFFGLHVSARPTQSLELAVSRTAQWCGSGRPCDFDTFVDLMLGNDNRGDEGIDLSNEPGNQLASVDVRWVSPLGDLPYAAYMQATAEDEAGGFPSRWIGLGGVEVWGRMESGWLTGNWRAHLEFTETTSEFYSTDRFDYTYEHFIYDDGYRYKGRAIGHSTDSDSRSIGGGVTLVTDNGDEWTAMIRWATLNREGDGAGDDLKHSVTSEETDLVDAQVSHAFDLHLGGLQLGRIDLSGGIRYADNQVSGDDQTDFVAMARWSWDFRSL